MKSRKVRIAAGAIAVAVIALVFLLFLPKIASYRDVWDVVQSLSREDLAALAAATIANLGTFAPPWMVALPGLRLRQAFVVTQASTALTIVAPGGAAPGMATSFAMLRAWGFRGQPVGLAVAVTGVWNQLFALGAPIVALALLTVSGGENPLLQTAALIGLGVFVAVLAGFAVGLRSDARAHRIGDLAARLSSRGLRLIRRGPVTWDGSSFAGFRRQAVGLLARRWHLLTLATLAGQLTVFSVLVVSLRTVGVAPDEVSLVEAFAAWTLIRLLGSIPITPGGLGVIELGLTSLLVGFGGDDAEVVAAVLVYRFLTVVPTLVLGAIAAATSKLHHPDRAAGS